MYNIIDSSSLNAMENMQHADIYCTHVSSLIKCIFMTPQLILPHAAITCFCIVYADILKRFDMFLFCIFAYPTSVQNVIFKLTVEEIFLPACLSDTFLYIVCNTDE